MRLALLALLLAGCASNHAVLRHADGREVTCQSSGTGAIPRMIANNRFEECLNNAQMQGFHKAP
jgi:hypothetical protein